MNAAKRLSALALILALLLLPGAAFAEDAQYETTRAFLEGVKDMDGFSCEFMGAVEIDSVYYEMLRVTYYGEGSVYVSNMQLLFSEKLDEAEIYVYNLINFEPGRLAELLEAVNDMNAACPGIKFFVDKSDYSVTAELCQFLSGDCAFDLTMTALAVMVGYTDAVYEMLADYAI